MLFGCIRDQKGDGSSHLSVIQVGTPDDNIFPLSSLSDTFYVRLETNDSCLIKDVRRIFYLDDEIIIGSDNSILFFDKTKLLGNFVIDAIKYHVSFYSDKNYLFTIADNELYLDGKGHFVDSALKNHLGNIVIDDNPIIRICKVEH